MLRRRANTGATSIAFQLTRDSTSTFIRRLAKTHESIRDGTSRYFQRGCLGKKASPARDGRLDRIHGLCRRIRRIRIGLLYAGFGRAAVFAQARPAASQRRHWRKPGRVRGAPVFLDLSLPPAQEMGLAREAGTLPAPAWLSRTTGPRRASGLQPDRLPHIPVS